MVYFVRGQHLVKIGYSRFWMNRVRNMQKTSPIRLTVLAVIEGDVSVERFYHQRFAHLRKRGEWFAYTADLREFVEAEIPLLRLDRSNGWQGTAGIPENIEVKH